MPPVPDETTRFLNAWMEVRQIVQAANFNRFHRAGLSATQFMTMNLVPKSGTTLSELARRLNLSAATLSATVNSLEERGLLRRTRDSSDARKVTISATQEGQEIKNSTSLEFHTFISGVFLQLSKSRRNCLVSGLEEMVRLSQSGTGNSSMPGAAIPAAGGAVPAERSSRRSPRR